MCSRGQDSFKQMPGFGVKLYGQLTKTQAITRQHREIAQDLTSRIAQGRLLDIGTGPGQLLLQIHHLNPDIELFGLDISTAMVQLAKEKLSDINVDLRQGSIDDTDYKNDFFDLVTCTGSFYLWDNPIECLNEIFRILKKGQSAYLFETHQDFEPSELQEGLRINLKDENLFWKIISPLFLKRQLRMTYPTREIAKIISQTDFAKDYDIEPINLSGLPVWLRIKLTKRIQ